MLYSFNSHEMYTEVLKAAEALESIHTDKFNDAVLVTGGADAPCARSAVVRGLPANKWIDYKMLCFNPIIDTGFTHQYRHRN